MKCVPWCLFPRVMKQAGVGWGTVSPLRRWTFKFKVIGKYSNRSISKVTAEYVSIKDSTHSDNHSYRKRKLNANGISVDY